MSLSKTQFFLFFESRNYVKAAPGIKPILFTQVHYHLHQRSYLHHRPQTPDRTHMG